MYGYFLSSKFNTSEDMPQTKAQEYFEDSLNRVGFPKKFLVVSDSIWDKPTYVIDQVIEDNMLELGVEQVYIGANATMDSTEWVNGDLVETMQMAIDECLGDGGEDTIVMFALGVNDVVFVTDKEYTWDDFKGPMATLKTNIQKFLNEKPNVKLFFVSAPATDTNSFNTHFERMYSEIAVHFGVEYISGYDATKGVRPAYQYTNQNSCFYNDNLHPNEMGLLRFWNFILMNVAPCYYLKSINPYEFAVPDADPDDAANITVINNGWRNDFDAGELRNTDNAAHYCFTKADVIPGQLFKLKLPTGLMGTFTPQVKWVTTDATLVGGEPTDLPTLSGDYWLIEAPYNVDRLHVNISDDAGFNAAYIADPTIAEMSMAYSRTAYDAPIEDIMIGFKNLLNY